MKLSLATLIIFGSLFSPQSQAQDRPMPRSAAIISLVEHFREVVEDSYAEHLTAMNLSQEEIEGTIDQAALHVAHCVVVKIAHSDEPNTDILIYELGSNQGLTQSFDEIEKKIGSDYTKLLRVAFKKYENQCVADVIKYL